MIDGIISGTGNSRYLKIPPNAKAMYPTLDALLDAMIAGTFAFDLNGINPDGWDVLGTQLNKPNLLSDETAAKYGLGADATINDVLENGVAALETGFYVGTSTGSYDPVRITLHKKPKLLLIVSRGEPSSSYKYPIGILNADYKEMIVQSGTGSYLTGFNFSVNVTDEGAFWNGDKYRLNNSGTEYYYTAFL